MERGKEIDYKARNSSSLDDNIRVVADRNRKIAVTPDSSHDNIEKGFASAYDDKFHKKQEKRRHSGNQKKANGVMSDSEFSQEGKDESESEPSVKLAPLRSHPRRNRSRTPSEESVESVK